MAVALAQTEVKKALERLPSSGIRLDVGDQALRLRWTAEVVSTAIGKVPTPESLNVEGLDLSADTLAELLRVDNESWRQEIPLITEHFSFIGERLPGELADELAELEKNLSH
jgi:phosphoenolpyruvate carboxykinase (GTP)